MISLRFLTLMSMLALVSIAQAATAQEQQDPVAYDTGRYMGIPWASGGAGEEARNVMMEELSDYNLRLEFAVTAGNYLGDIAVTVSRAGGGAVLRAFSSGPWLMAKLPAGTYTVRASGYGETFDETVQVPATGMETIIFNQWTKEGVDAATPGPWY